MAIKVVSEAKQEKLSKQLLNFLLGAVDSTPKVHFVKSFQPRGVTFWISCICSIPLVLLYSALF